MHHGQHISQVGPATGALVPLIIGFSVNGWNVCRALHRRGLTSVAFDNNPQSIFWKSRGARMVACEHLGGFPLLDSLQTLAADGRTYGLISATEEAVRTLGEHRDQLPANILLAFPDGQTVDMLLDKRLFYGRAVAEGCRIYPMHFLKSWQELEPESERRFPCILKARRKIYAPGLAKAYRIQDEAELWKTIGQIARIPGVTPEDFVIQQWVPGGDGDVVFCMQYYDQSNTPVISFVGRKIRQWRPETGGTSSAETLSDAEALAETTRFFKAVRMRGICSMEFKRSSQDGKLYMIEPTVCRADYQEGVAVANGYNIPFAAYCDLAGIEGYSPQPVRKPVKWVHVGDDYRSALQYIASRRLTRWKWLTSLRGPKSYAVYDPSDPGPFLTLAGRKIRNRVTKLCKKM